MSVGSQNQAQTEGEERERLCPRCGGRISWIERHKHGGRVYLVAVHYLGYDKETGRKNVRKCYLGPEDAYEYVSKIHEREGLELKGLADSGRALEYLDVLINYISKVELDPEVRKSLGSKFIELGRKLLEGVGSGGKG